MYCSNHDGSFVGTATRYENRHHERHPISSYATGGQASSGQVVNRYRYLSGRPGGVGSTSTRTQSNMHKITSILI